MKTKVILSLAAIAVVAALTAYIVFPVSAAPGPTVAFEGNSTALQQTQVVPTLASPIINGKNTIWCASFQAAWKTLQLELAGEPVIVDGAEEVSAALNNSPDPRPHLPAGSFYTAAGWNDEGIVAEIQTEMSKLFPNAARPQFPGILPDSFVAYGYLAATVKFQLPYFQNDKPLVFNDASGGKTYVTSFGLRREDEAAFFEMRRQVGVLYSNMSRELGLEEVILDLDVNSMPSQLILAMMAPKPTLLETVAHVVHRLRLVDKDRRTALGPNDVLLVPDIVWRISHHFGELEGKSLQNETLKNQGRIVAQQDISFRLDRSGADVESEAKLYAGSGPMQYVFDRPFLVLMRTRDSEQPYFAMWVDNAELLSKWPLQATAKNL